MGRKLSILPVIFFLLLPAAFAQTQSHPLSQVTPIDTNLDMFGYNLTNAGYLLYNTGIVAAGTRGIPTADIQASAVTGAKIAAGVVSSSKLANPLGGSINASAYYDSDNSTYYLDPAGTGNSLVVAGSIGIGNTTPALKLHISHTSFPQLRFQDTQSGGTTMDMGVGTTGFGIRASNLVTPFII
jgi:hypothetical protein